jgi:hypothetical protein
LAASQARELSQRIEQLQRQSFRLQHEIDALRRPLREPVVNSYDLNAWWQRQHRGEGGTDPALFQ